MAAAAILEITFLAITQPFLHAFAPNLKRRLEMGSHSQIYRENLHSAKIHHTLDGKINKEKNQPINGNSVVTHSNDVMLIRVLPLDIQI